MLTQVYVVLGLWFGGARDVRFLEGLPVPRNMVLDGLGQELIALIKE